MSGILYKRTRNEQDDETPLPIHAEEGREVEMNDLSATQNDGNDGHDEHDDFDQTSLHPTRVVYKRNRKETCYLLWAIIATFLFLLLVAIAILAHTPKRKVKWCTVNDAEQKKCSKMSELFMFEGLRPVFQCISGDSIDDCIHKIDNNVADAITIPNSYLFKYRNLLYPIMAEDYKNNDFGSYFVAVVKKTDSAVNFTSKSLIKKRACVEDFDLVSGYLYNKILWQLIRFLINTQLPMYFNGWRLFRIYFALYSDLLALECGYGNESLPLVLSLLMKKKFTGILPNESSCMSPHALAHIFGSELCAPTSSKMDGGCPEMNLASIDQRMAKCLFESEAPAIGFVDHLSLAKYIASNQSYQGNDYQLLCPDGTRSNLKNYKSCHLFWEPSNSVVVSSKIRSGSDVDVPVDITEVLHVAQLYFGSHFSVVKNFTMFKSDLGKDLLFQDATQKLMPLFLNCTAEAYLGVEYMRYRLQYDCETWDDSNINQTCLLPQYA